MMASPDRQHDPGTIGGLSCLSHSTGNGFSKSWTYRVTGRMPARIASVGLNDGVHGLHLTIFRTGALIAFSPDSGWSPVRSGGIAGRHQ